MGAVIGYIRKLEIIYDGSKKITKEMYEKKKKKFFKEILLKKNISFFCKF